MLMVSQKVPQVVTPAKAGVQRTLERLDSRLRGNDRKGRFPTSYEAVNVVALYKAHWLFSSGNLKNSDERQGFK
jgi:hypothetical protein